METSIFSFNHRLNKYLLSSYYVYDTVLGARYIMRNKAWSLAFKS